MTDIVQELRATIVNETPARYPELVSEAADTIARQRVALEIMMIGGNHLASHRTDRWIDYPLDGLTRAEQCEHALRRLGATPEYDMWCCWSSIMQARDLLTGE
jgi:hypothetical protein